MGIDTDADDRLYWQAADRYTHLRRRYMLAYIWGAIFLIAGIALASLFKDLGLPVLAEVVGQASRAGFLATLILCLIPCCQLNWFRCPSCGNRFAVSRWGFRPGNRCCHCGLDLGPGRAKVVDMAPDDESEWNRDEPGRDSTDVGIPARTEAAP